MPPAATTRHRSWLKLDSAAALGQVGATSAIYAPEGDPLAYPCELTEAAMMVVAGQAVPIDWDWPHHTPTSRADGRDVDAVLRARGAAGIEQRVAQIAFGANRDLGNVLWKLEHYAQGQRVSKDFVALPGYIDDCDVVACNLAYWGNFYGSLLLHRPPYLDRPYLAGARTPVCVLLLDHDQMQCIHRSEGVIAASGDQRPHLNCDVAHFDVSLHNNVTIHAQLYALSLPYLSFDGMFPVAFCKVDTWNRSRHMPAMSQLEMLDAVVEHLDVDVPAPFERNPGQWLADTIRGGRLHACPRGLELYKRVRARIIEQLCLRDSDGRVRCGNHGLPGLLPVKEAWSPAPTLARVPDKPAALVQE